MKKPKSTKLALSTTTIRVLKDVQLASVAGGDEDHSAASTCSNYCYRVR